jgi:hypothetical protein
MSAKHIHLYEQINIAKTPGKKYLVWACKLANCTHYLTTIENKEALCWGCRTKMIVTADLMKPRPLCVDCTLNKIWEDLSAILRGLEVAV